MELRRGSVVHGGVTPQPVVPRRPVLGRGLWEGWMLVSGRLPSLTSGQAYSVRTFFFFFLASFPYNSFFFILFLSGP